MSFWEPIISDMDDDERVDRVKSDASFWSSIDEIVDGMTANTWKINHKKMEDSNNLPIAKIEDSNGKCETCNRENILGNGLCMDCWDLVVDNSSANAKDWPDAKQHKAIKLAHS